jgi:hypothetical protein
VISQHNVTLTRNHGEPVCTLIAVDLELIALIGD